MTHFRRFVILAACLVALSGLALADSITFTATPSAISGSPGQTIGWGYSIVNNTPYYLLADALNTAGTFPSDWNPDSSYFDYPEVAPGATVSETFIPDAFGAGLFQLELSPTATPGTVTNQFDLSYSLYAGDPYFNGTFVANGDAFASYSATVVAGGGNAVPEPATWALFAGGAGVLGVLGLAGKLR